MPLSTQTGTTIYIVHTEMIWCIILLAKPAPFVFATRTGYMIAAFELPAYWFTLRTVFYIFIYFEFFKSRVEVLLAASLMFGLQTICAKDSGTCPALKVFIIGNNFRKIWAFRTFFKIIALECQTFCENLFKFFKDCLWGFGLDKWFT